MLFGHLRDGRSVERIDLAAGQLRACVLTLGAILQDVRFVEGPGLTAGSAELSAYESGPLAYAGAIVGPVANRIGGAGAVLDGVALRFEANAAGGHHLHGGRDGLHAHVWQVVRQGPDRVCLACALPHGLGGYPGARQVEAEYVLTPEALTLNLTAQSDAPTLFAPANHSYWTLGDGVDGTHLRIAADRVLGVDETVLPTGEVLPVDGTRLDFREGRTLAAGDRLDTCFCLGDADAGVRPVAWLSGGGVAVEMATTAPGLQVFTADPFVAPGPVGHDGRRYGPRFGLALEAQAWPDAANRPAFPSVRLDPHAPFVQTTQWRFRRAAP